MLERPLPKKKRISGIPFVLDAFGAYVPEDKAGIRRTRIWKPSDCLPFLLPLRDSLVERFVVLTLDSAHQVINVHGVTKGLVNCSLVHPRETLFWAIKDLAVGIIVAHNHPSGSLLPSPEDLVTTRSLSEASRLLRIPLLDHLIVASTGFTSIREAFPDYFHSKGLS